MRHFQLSVLHYITAIVLTVGTLSTAAQPTPAPRPQSVGLVLSGGGAKGIAHVGVIRALEENNIPIDYITGTSMGAIIGGLYAAGYTTDEMMEMLLSNDFAYWSTGRINPTKVYYFSRQEPTPAMFNVPISRPDSTVKSVPASLISPLPMNFAFMDIFAAYTAQCGGDFNRLFVPFRCIASDVNAGHKVVHAGGDLGDAIRTSMSFPLVFQPIRMDGALLYDGGIYDNFPVDVMTDEFAPDFILGVDVSSFSDGPQNSLMDQMENLVMRNQSYEVPADRGIKLRVYLDEFSLLDFPAAQKIYQIGYNRAMSMMDSICQRVTSRIPAVTRNTARSVFKSKTPYVHFDSVNVSGGTPRQNSYIRYLFEPAHADTFGLAHARESYYRAISPGRLQDLFPKAVYNDTTGLFGLNLDATPKSNLSLGIGGYITSSTNSYLFASIGYKTLSFTSISANINAWIGQSYMAGYLNAAITHRTAVPSSSSLVAVASRQRYFESDRLFFDERIPSFIISHEYFARYNYTVAAGPRAKIDFSAGFGHLDDSFFRNDIIPAKDVHRDYIKYNLGQVRAHLTSSTLNDISMPTAGAEYNVLVEGVLGKYRYRAGDDLISPIEGKPTWLQAEIRTRNYFDLSKHFSLGIESDILWSSRKLIHNYNADLVTAPAYNPTPVSFNTFNRALHANSFIAAAIVPVYKYNSNLSARLNLHTFVPMRSILPAGDAVSHSLTLDSRYGGWFTTARFYGELDIAYTLPINATLSGYVNYVSSGNRPWGVGINIGIFLTAPRFLR